MNTLLIKSFIPNLKKGIVLAFLLSLPTQLGIHFWPDFTSVLGIRIDYLSPTIYLSDLLAIILICLFLKFNFKKTFWIWFFQLFLYLFTTSILLSQNQGAALYKLYKIFEFIFLGLALYQAREFGRDFLSKGLSIVVIFIFFLGILQFIKGSSIGFWALGERFLSGSIPSVATVQIFGQEFLRPYATFSHPNSLAGFVLVSLLLLFPWKSKLEKAALLLGIGLLILAWSQTVWLGLLVYFSWLLLNKRLKIFDAISLAVILFLSLLPVIFADMLRTQEIVTRKILFEASVNVFLQNPLLGIGLNNFIPRLPEFLPSNKIWILQPVHNIYLLLLTEFGIIGSILLFWGARFLNLKHLLKAFPFWAILLTGTLDHYWLTLQQNQLLLVVTLAYLLKTKEQ